MIKLSVVDLLISMPTFAQRSENKDPKKVEKKPLDCITILMSEPICIDRLNATNFCEKGRVSEVRIKMIQKCMTKMSSPNDTQIRKNSVIAACLAEFSSNSSPKSKETYCNQNTSEAIFINDSSKSIVKEKQSADGSPTNNNAVAK